MLIEKKKRLVVPLNNPRPPSPVAQFVVAILRPPLMVLGFIFGSLYKISFGLLDKRAARKNDQRFAEDIRTYLSFLFTEKGARIMPNEGVLFRAFDGAYVTVAVGILRLRFCRGRGDFSVVVASEFAPQHWEDFLLVADGIGEWETSQPRPRGLDSLESFGDVLRPRLEPLLEALSKDRFEATLNNAVKTHNRAVDEYAATLRQSGIIPKLY
jgi:hypothetical protein